ncbi:hypothetical protein [Microbulbifer yueqingensis]|uniref:Spore coat protein U (SCPU) domain-containing protein n=1 Tax=Microbulbifer yueqingensis TaxID=658219 RepID=A0A1G8VMR9_9GAMM|nr:hypothetical protein [Microbulbifer yueqingensis]SDJ67272.1 hypothetical protein SAMN05216212_0642 [Microbulbifer yueqingensis]
MLPTNRPALLVLLLCLMLQAGLVNAESTNARPCDNGAGPPDDPTEPGYDERLIGVCSLENTSTTLPYQPSARLQGEVNFSVRSCSPDGSSSVCDFATPYTVMLTGTSTKNGNKFVLLGESGQGDVTVKLAYRSGGRSEELDSGKESALFPGGANGQQVPAAIEVSLQNLGQLKEGSYSGTFSLALVQCGSKGLSGSVPCDGSKPTTRIAAGEEITFTINLAVASAIRISGLADMLLQDDGSGTYTDSQDFCVFSSSGTPFRITADSLTGNGSFLLQGGAQALAYETTVTNLASGGTEQLREGVISSSTWPGHPLEDCNGYTEENMSLVISVLPSEIGNATETNYVDTLTLTVEAQ